MQFSVAEAAAGTRLDAFLHRSTADTAPPWSQKRIRELCQLGAIAIDGIRAMATTRLRSGNLVTCHAADPELSLALGLTVVYRDEELLVLHKPPGLAVHGGPLVDHSVAAALAQHLPGSGLLQRLDREASGLLLAGLHSAALRRLSAAMEQGSIAREYLAITAGEIATDERSIDLPLRITDEPRGDRPKAIVDPTGQRAVSHLRVLLRRKGHSLVLVRLATGRTHQIRAHLAAIGHPLLGDPRYGNQEANARARATFGTTRTLLHGARLHWPGPDGETKVAVAAHEPDFARVFAGLRHLVLPAAAWEF